MRNTSNQMLRFLLSIFRISIQISNLKTAALENTFKCSQHTSIQAFQYKIIHRTLPCNEWLTNIKTKPDSKCTYCNNTDSITHFLIDCKSNKLFWKCLAKL